MALYCAVAWQTDLERNLNLESDSSVDEINMRPEREAARVHARGMVGRSDSATSSRSVTDLCRNSHACPVHRGLQNSRQTAPPEGNNHHRNCPRAQIHPNPTTAVPTSTDSNSEVVTPLEVESDKTRRWACLRIIGSSSVGSRTAKLGYRALWSVITDFLPWIIGSYIIFQAFKYGLLELGLAAFLLMLSVHGVLKWCNARGRDKQEERLAECESEARVDSLCGEHHHHHHLDHDSDTEFSSSDDSDLEDDAPSISKVIILMDEPPPSYDIVSRTAAQDSELDLHVHLTPRHPRSDHKDLSIMTESVYPGIDNQEIGELTRPQLISYTSCMSSEMEDESLPSYSDAVKKIKRKKKRNRVRRGENSCSAEEETLFRPLNDKDIAKNCDIVSTTSDEALPEVQQNVFESMSCNPACVTVVQETSRGHFVNSESTPPSRASSSDLNSLLDNDATYSSCTPSREPYM